jgi:hypothetical protein
MEHVNFCGILWYIHLYKHFSPRYDGVETKQRSLCYVFVGVYVNLCTVAVIELIVFSYNEVIVQ